MNIVVIGGGTGSFVVLKGLKKYVDTITAVVSMFDNGGSTGVLRDEFGVLPPGDVRRCLVALADESVMRDLFIYRFKADCSLNGHSFGNLFLTALSNITGSDARAIKHASRILRIKGKVLPVSLDDAHLCAELEDKSVLKGETLIDIPERDPELRITDVWLEPSAKLNPDVREAIVSADLVVLGPGDLFTSVIPNLLVEGMTDALKSAKLAYVCNLMTKPGETAGFSVSDHVSAIKKFGCAPDFVICSDSVVEPELLEKYAVKGQRLVSCDRENIDTRIVEADLTSRPDLVRHDSDRLAQVILDLA